MAITIADKLERIGQPDPGFQLNGDFIFPTRDDAADAGLRYGGRILSLNGVEPPASWSWVERRTGAARTLGART
jgi:hypothetical protein